MKLRLDQLQQDAERERQRLEQHREQERRIVLDLNPARRFCSDLRTSAPEWGEVIRASLTDVVRVCGKAAPVGRGEVLRSLLARGRVVLVRVVQVDLVEEA